jgi:hypothetical protein
MQIFQRDLYATQAAKGVVLLELYDTDDELILVRSLPNVITYDAGIAMARLIRDSRLPAAGKNNGVTMLAVGTGATGADPNNPDRPQPEQRRLNREVFRKTFAAVVNRDQAGRAVSYDTNVVDFVTVLGDGEAVAPLNEMALILPADPNPGVTNPISQKPLQYDPTVDVRGKDLLLNYFTFGVVNKPMRGRLKITWRITL